MKCRETQKFNRSDRLAAEATGIDSDRLIVAFTILMLLTTMAVPPARFRVRREREKELRWALADFRKAIDKYKDAT